MDVAGRVDSKAKAMKAVAMQWGVVVWGCFKEALPGISGYIGAINKQALIWLALVLPKQNVYTLCMVYGIGCLYYVVKAC